eukprot:scaffold162246_cov33-Tisochrysis_lutea.AAC.1
MVGVIRIDDTVPRNRCAMAREDDASSPISVPTAMKLAPAWRKSGTAASFVKMPTGTPALTQA